MMSLISLENAKEVLIPGKNMEKWNMILEAQLLN
jgi:hypothetical protein